MKAKIATFAKILPVLLVAGCGAANTATGTGNTAGTATKAAPVQATATKDADLNANQITIQGAYARLRGPGIVSAGGHASLWLDVWSTEKQIRSYDAQWYANDGRLDRLYTYSSGYNGWWAPFNPFFQNTQIQARVRVNFEDGTTASGTVGLNVWVQKR